MDSHVSILKTEILSKHWYTLTKVTFRFLQRNGDWIQLERESYDRGNGAVILPFNRSKGSVILIRQFRLPTLLNGNPDGMLVEACAGLLDLDDPDDCIRREAQEEVGLVLGEIKKVYEAYTSPASVTELLYFYVAEYDGSMRTGKGGGIVGEEDIEVLEIPFVDAWAMVRDGRIKDAKTIMLLQYLKAEGLVS